MDGRNEPTPSRIHMKIIDYIKEKPVNIALAVVFIASLGLCVFFLITERSENRLLKKYNVQIQAENTQLKEANASILNEVKIKDEIIRKSTVVYDSLKTTLEKINQKNIVTNYATYHTVTNLDLNGQIDLLSSYLSEADSLGR